MEYCYVFDYCSGEIYEIEVTEQTSNLETEDFLKFHGLNVDNCYAMFTEDKKVIKHLTD